MQPMEGPIWRVAAGPAAGVVVRGASTAPRRRCATAVRWRRAWTIAALALVRTTAAVDNAEGRLGAAASTDAEGPLIGNPTLELYRRTTAAYLRQAREAEEDARFYAQKTQEQLSLGAAQTRSRVAGALRSRAVDTWAFAAWAVQKMLDDPAPAKAAAAAEKASAPYEERLVEYEKAKSDYGSAAQSYAERANEEANQARELQGYSNQYKLQGNPMMSETYEAQAKMLMNQAEAHKGLATDYSSTANKIFAAIPKIQDWAVKAKKYAYFLENPTNKLEAKDVYPYIVVPPAPEPTPSMGGGAEIATAPAGPPPL